MVERIVACICEGGAESEIIRILLENDRLIFREVDLLDGKTLRCRSGKEFQEQYLRMEHPVTVEVFRILDSRRERFKIDKAYIHKVEVREVITSPEIEMLIILKEGKAKEYEKSGLKPSEYCKGVLRMKKVKQREFIREYFSDVDDLIECLRIYKSRNQNSRELTLYDLVRQK
jgi:hypothetical protein